MNWKKNDNFAFLGLFLGLTGILSAGVLAVTNGIVAPRIAVAEERAKAALFGDLVPPFDNAPGAEKLVLDGVTLYPARRGGRLTGVIAETPGSGYGGKLTLLAGLTPDGAICRVLVVEDKETPGLGKKCTARKFQKTIGNFWKPAPAGVPPNPFLDQFNGQSRRRISDWRVRKDGGVIRHVTGATVTSRAIASAIDRATAAAEKFLAGEAAKAGKDGKK